jgi:hypothetical protein
VYRSHLTLAATATSAVPFWLQITAIVLAPLAGFAGIATGAYLKTRTDRADYLRDERRKVYVTFIHAFGGVISITSTVGATAIRTRRDLAATTQSIQTGLIDLEKVRQEVELIGSRPAATAAGDALVYIAAVTSYMAAALRDGFDRESWNEVMQFGMQTQSAFLHAAQVDLGMPKDQQMPPRPGPDAALRKKLQETAKGIVEEALAEERAEKAAANTTPAPSP